MQNDEKNDQGQREINDTCKEPDDDMTVNGVQNYTVFIENR